MFTMYGKGAYLSRMNWNDYDCLIIGSGFAGAVAARELAERGNRKVLVLERRNHTGGNAYDCPDESGILIHRYGPHIFHTNTKRVFDYLSRFTEWRVYEHKVAGNVHGQLMPIPFNLHSLYKAFASDKAALLEQKLLASYGAGRKVTILELKENPDPDLSALAEYVYENIFVYYTQKQWGVKPEEIDPLVTARVPIVLSRDDRYFQDVYQGIPRNGYAALFHRMLDHPNIRVLLNTEAGSVLHFENNTVFLSGTHFPKPVIYTGAADELFGCRFGRLPYRTLDFQFETQNVTWYQAYGTVNYTVDRPYTRITEFKRLTGQNLEGKTTIAKEYSRPYTGENGEIPYYAILNPKNLEQYQRYRDLSAALPRFHLLGRLAEYKYYNMDAIVHQALLLADRLMEEQENESV